MKKKSLAILLPVLFTAISCISITKPEKIDRYKLVTRHNIVHSSIDPLNALTVGNGEFAYTADITGMQSFPEFYETGIPLGTQSQWGWHEFPNPENYSLDDIYKMYFTGTDSIPYAYQHTLHSDERKNKASTWLRENLHRLHLGLIGMQILKIDSAFYTICDILKPEQQLNLWTGELTSYFEIDGEPVEVITLCHQELDIVTFRISSRLVSSGRIQITLRFPYATHEKFSKAYDLDQPEKHTTCLAEKTRHTARFERKLDEDLYYVQLGWKPNASLEKISEHFYVLTPVSDNNDVMELNCHFSADSVNKKLPSFTKTIKNNKKHWKKFWNSGAAVDFSDCTDSRAQELERRVVLSQYLTKIQCSGSLPPQETGLTYNSWHGKFHLEMHWWHAVHFILWSRPKLMEQQLNFYTEIFDKARHTACMQGYEGVRWPKMIGPDGRESPSTIGPFLIWQQPHFIYFAELLYRYYGNSKNVLENFKSQVFATAEFMASFVQWDSLRQRYILPPPLIPAQECFNEETTLNPVFELAYWRWGLETAQKWKQRSGIETNIHWQNIIDRLADLPVSDNLYLFSENTPDSYSNPGYLTDHPIVLAIQGFLPPSEKIDINIMENTLNKIVQKWNWQTAWGWDFPLAAMNAVTLNKPELAIELLLMNSQKNSYLMNGHNYQDSELTLYLPGNGALLTTVAFMCSYRNTQGNNGFPANGTWEVKYEDIHCMY